MPYIIYNGVISSSLGLQVESMSSPPPPVRQYEYTAIPGADGQLVRDYGTYEDIQIEVRFNCMNSDGAATAKLNSWLTGTGTLVHSDDFLHYYKVKAVQMNTRYRYRPYGNNYDSFSAIFLCEPYRYEVADDVRTPTSGSTITNSHNTASLPKIVLTGTSPMTLVLNGNTFSIAATAATIDCDSHMVFNGTTPLNSSTDLVGSWPKLNIGSNTISFSNVSAISLYPRWRDL